MLLCQDIESECLEDDQRGETICGLVSQYLLWWCEMTFTGILMNIFVVECYMLMSVIDECCILFVLEKNGTYDSNQ